MAQPAQRSLKFAKKNVDPSIWPVAVDHSSADAEPNPGGLFRALNVSVAGTVTIYRADNTQVQVYLVQGWNPQAGWKIKTSGGTGTVIAAEIEKGP